MPTYYIDTLLSFLKYQREIGFETIYCVLDILEDETHFEEDKYDAVMFLLRKAGLNEVTHKGGRFKLEHLSEKENKEKSIRLDDSAYNGAYMVELMGADLLNGSALFEFSLN